MALMNKPLDPGLYVTATPIGNLGDITFRAVETLKAADLILCEDTRQTAKLCAAYGINTPRSPYHDHNAARVRPGIIKKLQDGAVVCLVSDAGTPTVSDPGMKLVRDARDAGVMVTALPGPSAALAALSMTGAPSDQFYFIGFLPTKTTARRRLLETVRPLPATLIFYETAPRLSETLAVLDETLGARPAIVAREITKLHEDVRDGALRELSDHYRENPTKGEIVILVCATDAPAPSAEEIDAFLKDALTSGSVKDAAAAAASELGVSRKDAYARALALKDGGS